MNTVNKSRIRSPKPTTHKRGNQCECPTCGADYIWPWEDAFDKFGFGDGDGLVMTEAVADALREHGYGVTVEAWGMHNVVITAIDKDGVPFIPDEVSVGYDDPRTYLPRKIVVILDKAFPS